MYLESHQIGQGYKAWKKTHTNVYMYIPTRTA